MEVILNNILEQILKEYSLSESSLTGVQYSINSADEYLNNKRNTIELINSLEAISLGITNKLTHIDINNYKKNKQEGLILEAESTANKVIESKSSIELQPMNSFDRMLVHVVLKDKEFIKTSSTGENRNRRVVISYQD